MPISFEFKAKEKYLLCTARGITKTLAEVQEYAGAVLAEAGKTGFKRILLDERELPDELNAYDITLFAKNLAAELVPVRGLRVAVICTSAKIDIIKTYETMLQNRSMNYRGFTDLDAALEWLTA